jgi:hypothetical protein
VRTLVPSDEIGDSGGSRYIGGLSVAAGGKAVVLAGEPGGVRLYREGEAVTTVLEGEVVDAVELSSDAQTLWAIAKGKGFLELDLVTGQTKTLSQVCRICLVAWNDEVGEATQLWVSGDGDRLAFGGTGLWVYSRAKEDGWEIGGAATWSFDPQVRHALRHPSDRLDPDTVHDILGMRQFELPPEATGLAADPRGRAIYVDAGLLWVWDPVTDERWALMAVEPGFSAVRVSPDGTQLLEYGMTRWFRFLSLTGPPAPTYTEFSTLAMADTR